MTILEYLGKSTSSHDFHCDCCILNSGFFSGNDVFGKPTIRDSGFGILDSSAIGNRFLFTGREYIAEIDLYDYRNRYYSHELGRFLQKDPIGFDGGDVNLYRYVGNNAVNWVDPDGKFPTVLYLILEAAWMTFCHQRATELAEKYFRGEDKKQHCYASCYFNRCKLLTAPHITALGGLLHELGPGHWDPQDLKANLYGIIKSYTFQSCYDSCNTCPVKD